MTHTVDKDNVRLDVFIASEWGVSRSNAKTVIERDGAFVNGVKRQKSGFELKIGDVVEFDVPAPETLEVKAENIPLDIVYEDEYMAVVNKPQGMVVHQASSYKKKRYACQCVALQSRQFERHKRRHSSRYRA